MRILFLTNTYPDFESSYRGIFIKKMATLLQKDGYQISVVTPKIYRESQYHENQNGIHIYRFPFFAGNKLLIEHEKVPFVRMILYYFSGLLTTTYVILRRKCQLIHVHWVIPTGLIGFLVSLFLKRTFIVTIHGTDLRMALKKRGILKRIFISICRRASHIHCVSEVQKKEIESFGLENKKISVFPMGIEYPFIESGEKKKEDEENRSFVILSNRNLLPIYNVSLLIKAIPIILKEEPQIKFIIAGEGSERTQLEKEIYKLNLNSSVKFIGRVPHKDMPELLAQSHIYVSTSLYDGTSVSLLEGMASGCFPVVSDIPPNREWIRDGENGFLFPVNDESILAKKIISAIRNRTIREKSRKENFKIIREKALWPVNIQKIKAIYESQLNRKHSIGS
jgi:glycosyltransferase involved in cell wall biosynthesis